MNLKKRSMAFIGILCIVVFLFVGCGGNEPKPTNTPIIPSPTLPMASPSPSMDLTPEASPALELSPDISSSPVIS